MRRDQEVEGQIVLRRLPQPAVDAADTVEPHLVRRGRDRLGDQGAAEKVEAQLRKRFQVVERLPPAQRADQQHLLVAGVKRAVADGQVPHRRSRDRARLQCAGFESGQLLFRPFEHRVELSELAADLRQKRVLFEQRWFFQIAPPVFQRHVADGEGGQRIVDRDPGVAGRLQPLPERKSALRHRLRLLFQALRREVQQFGVQGGFAAGPDGAGIDLQAVAAQSPDLVGPPHHRAAGLGVEADGFAPYLPFALPHGEVNLPLARLFRRQIERHQRRVAAGVLRTVKVDRGFGGSFAFPGEADVAEQEGELLLADSRSPVQPAAPLAVARRIVQHVEAEFLQLPRVERREAAPRDRRFVQQRMLPRRSDLQADIGERAGRKRFAAAPAVRRRGAVPQPPEAQLDIVGVVAGQDRVVQRVEGELEAVAPVERLRDRLVRRQAVAHQRAEIEVLRVMQQIDGRIDVQRPLPVRDHPVFFRGEKERQRAAFPPLRQLSPEFKGGVRGAAEVIPFLLQYRAVSGPARRRPRQQYRPQQCFDHAHHPYWLFLFCSIWALPSGRRTLN